MLTIYGINSQYLAFLFFCRRSHVCSTNTLWFWTVKFWLNNLDLTFDGFLGSIMV